ncbi:hypothetical protein [Saccharopolyspora sp. 5N708]|uniref:hypothetical protein n=1 Tax=Saccharopolyspora sp. 5N708 TaxID=3457424 RepID=UPI003FD02A5E
MANPLIRTLQAAVEVRGIATDYVSSLTSAWHGGHRPAEHPMTDSCDGTSPSDVPRKLRAAEGRSAGPCPLIWLALVICAAGTAVFSRISNLSILIATGFGLATMALGGILIVQHHRNRRR